MSISNNPISVVTVGVQGPAGPPGPAGVDGSIGGSHVHNQASASTTWTITHNLGFYPNITVYDSGGNIIEGEETHDSANQMTLTFSVAVGGSAYLS